MNYSIPENRLNNVILKTIDVAYDPKKMYVEPLLDANDNDENALAYRNEEGELVFMVYFEDYFIYGDKYSKMCPLLAINDREFVYEMHDLFGNKWEPVFIKWFEDNFHVPIKTLD
jgi:hypothetical protein